MKGKPSAGEMIVSKALVILSEAEGSRGSRTAVCASGAGGILRLRYARLSTSASLRMTTLLSEAILAQVRQFLGLERDSSEKGAF